MDFRCGLVVVFICCHCCLAPVYIILESWVQPVRESFEERLVITAASPSASDSVSSRPENGVRQAEEEEEGMRQEGWGEEARAARPRAGGGGEVKWSDRREQEDEESETHRLSCRAARRNFIYLFIFCDPDRRNLKQHIFFTAKITERCGGM